MMKYKICVYAISKNEEKHADRFMDSASEADLVVVLDTGSSDRTVQALRNRGALVYSEAIQPWRFDSARNRALELVPEDVDICVVADIDEVYQKGWREELENAWRPECHIASVSFTDAADEQGAFPPALKRYRIHARHDVRWEYPVHEWICYTGDGDPVRMHFGAIRLGHFPDKEKSRAHYRGLLELHCKEHPLDAKRLFLLIRDDVRDKKYHACLESLRNYVLLPNASRPPEERASALWLTAYCLEMTGHKPEAKEWLLRAVIECPTAREPYMKAAIYAKEEGDWLLCYDMATKALCIETKTESLYHDPHSWGYVLYDCAAQAAYHLGRYPQAVAFGTKACALDKRARLRENLAKYRAALDGLGDD